MNNNALPPDDLDRTLTALADGTRRAILAKLSEGEARVTALAEPFDISLNSVSKHIRMLERAHLVRRSIRGREHFLSLNPTPLDQAAEWLDQQRAFWSRRLAALDRLLQPQHQTPAERPHHRKGRRR